MTEENQVEHINAPNNMISSQEVINASIRDTAMLVRFAASKWSATANDKEAELMTRQAAGATRAIGKVVKNLLSGCDTEYKALTSAVDGARLYHYHTTLAWVPDDSRVKRGPRLLPNTFFFEYVQGMNTRKTAMTKLLDDFLAVYVARVDEAKLNLGTLANTTEYPEPDAIRGLFSINFEFTPVPEGADFRGLSQDMLTVLGNKVDERVNSLVTGAMDEACGRLRDHLVHIAERLSDADKRFHVTMVDNAVETVRLLKGFNITNNPKFEEIRADFEKIITNVSVKELRGNPAIRSSVADDAQMLLSRLAEYQR